VTSLTVALLLGGKLETEVDWQFGGPANTILAAHSLPPLGLCFLPVSPKWSGVAGLTKIANRSEFCNQIMTSTLFRSGAEDSASFLYFFNFKTTF
jgi:hypothetical protein